VIAATTDTLAAVLIVVCVLIVALMLYAPRR
jgi:hypothetical protein